MFGYVNIYKDELKIKDYNLFRAHYCCLCKTLGKNNGFVSRFGLSYDMTFLLILLTAINDTDPKFKAERCIAHPTRKHVTMESGKTAEYVADVSCMLAYLKCLDDFHDDKSIKALFGLLMYRPCIVKAKKRYSEIYDGITALLTELSKLEKSKCSETDKPADCFARICELIFDRGKTDDERRTLRNLGYNLGRWIYLIDAAADYEQDKKSDSYNPILQKGIIPTDIEIGLTYNLRNIAAAYELLDIKRNDAVLRNILYDGLLMKQQSILYPRKEKTK